MEWDHFTPVPHSSGLHSVLAIGSLTVTISILKRQGQFPPCSRICLHNLIANASPISPAPASEFSSTPSPPRVQSYSSFFFFLNLCLSFHIKSPLRSLLPFQPCVMNKLGVAQGARVNCGVKLSWCQWWRSFWQENKSCGVFDSLVNCGDRYSIPA